MTKTKILVDAHVLDGKPQGTCAYIAGLYSELARRGVLKLYVATSKEASLQRWFTHLDHVEWVKLKSRSKYARLGAEFDRLARRIAPDHTHFQYITPLRKRGAWITTIHDLLFLDHPELFPAKYGWVNKSLFKLSARRSDLVLTVSEYSRQAITRHFGIPAERVHVTPNGVDGFFEQEFETIPGLNPGHYFVCVSRFEPRKNQHRLVRAFRKCRQDLAADFKLVLVGYPALAYPELNAELERAGRGVILLNSLSGPALRWLYRNSAAAVYPSQAEGFGIPPVEAVAAGGISYCADNTALSDLATSLHGTFDATDVAGLSRLLRRIGQPGASHPTPTKNVGEAYSWSNSADCFLRAIGQ